MKNADGVVIDWSDLTRLDTRSMAWEKFPGLDGTAIKVLSRDDDGNPMVFLHFMPPGELPGVELPHRHFHRTVTENAFVLAGELPHWEYATAQDSGELVLLREGFFMDRRPGSIHGLEPGLSSSIGCVILMWRDGTGTMVDEPDFAEETADVPYAARPAPAGRFRPELAAVVRDRQDVTLLDTRELAWEPFPGLAGAKVKVLSRDEHGNGMIWMVWLPPGEVPGVELPHRHYHRTVREFSFVLVGELPHWEYRDAHGPGELVIVREGFFMDRLPGSIHGLEKGPSSGTGCVLLQWRDGLGNWLGEPEAASETVDVPYP